MRQWTGEGRTAEDAADRGAAALGLNRKDVEFQILGDRSSGLLSLFGFRRVKVRVTEKPGRSRAEGFRQDPHGRREERFGRSGGRDGRRGEGRHEKSEDRDEEHTENRSRGHQDSRSDYEYRREPAPRAPARESGRDSGRGGRDNQRPAAREGAPRESGRDHQRQEFRREQPRGDRDRRDDRGSRGRQNRPDQRQDRQKPQEPRRQAAAEGRPAQEQRPRGPETFRPAVAPELLLEQWKSLFGWPDLAWDIQAPQGRRQTVLLKTEHGQRLAGSGRALEAFEYLFNLIASGGDREKPWLTFQLEGFPSADEQRVADKALHAAFQVRRSGRPYYMDPMPPALRRLVHQTLANHPDVETSSEGEGQNRKVVVKPRAAVAAGAPGEAAPDAEDTPPPTEGPAV